MSVSDDPLAFVNSKLTHALIPGGAHTYSKGDDQFPANAPRYLERGDGCLVWDDEGRQFIDWSMGLRSMSLGYGVPSVLDAAWEQMCRGSNFGRPSRLETALAADLCDLIPCAEMVKFAKNGSTITTAAVKLARAYTGRDMVALCADHPFFSYDDWFIGTTPIKRGIPETGQELSKTFRYNDLAGLQHLFGQFPGRIACVILEAATTVPPAPGFLEGVRALCTTHGSLLILDEMITGFRWDLNGAQSYYGITPDLATFGKGIGNGFAMAALVGRREFMEIGGLSHAGERIFLISTTHGAENHALAASREVVRIFREHGVVNHMWRIGALLKVGLAEAAADAGVSAQVEIGGYDCSPFYVCRDAAGAVSMDLRTLFLQEMVKENVLIPYIAPSFAHQAHHVERTVEAARKAFRIYAQALDEGCAGLLKGSAIKPVFRTYN
jgi:glutamate-1-semialdehyde 2,1-aminomutase